MRKLINILVSFTLLVAAKESSASLITDAASPVALAPNSAVGLWLTNLSPQPMAPVLQIPMSLLDAVGNPATGDAGTLFARTFNDPVTDFNPAGLSAAPAPGEQLLSFPLVSVDQPETVFGGSLNWGPVTAKLGSIASGQSVFESFYFDGKDGCSALTFLFDGFDEGIFLGMPDGWVASVDFNGDLVQNRATSGYGQNAYIAVNYSFAAVPEPGALGVLGVLSLLTISRRRQS